MHAIMILWWYWHNSSGNRLLYWKNSRRCSQSSGGWYNCCYSSGPNRDNVTMKKKLIEVALPLEAINKASVREKFPSQRHRLAATVAQCCCIEVCA